MTQVGDTLIFKHELFDITGQITVKAGEEAVVRKIEYLPYSGRYSRIRGCEDIYNPLEIMLIGVEGREGVMYRPSAFENCVTK